MSAAQTELGEMLAALADHTDLEELCAARVSAYFEEWTQDELDVLGWVAARLNKGRLRYGPLDLDRWERSLSVEEAEELEDSLVYGSMRRVLALRREAGREPLRLSVASCRLPEATS